MPHLTVEYTDNAKAFDPAGALRALNSTLVASGQFQEADVKARALPLHTFLVGTGTTEYSFVHVKLALLSGRSAQIKSELSAALLDTLRGLCENASSCPLKMTVEIVDLDRASYAKEVLLPK